MADKVSPVPRGYRTATPCLTVTGIDAAIEFYTSAFDAQEKVRLYGADGVSILHAELKIGNSVVFLNEEAPEHGIYSPATLGGSPTVVHLYVQDVDAWWSRALAAGAIEVMPITDTYWGDRLGKLVDPFGHVWSIASRVERVSHDELAERARQVSRTEWPLEESSDLAA